MALHVLVVEDEVAFREGLCDLLNLQGFAASGVGSIASFNAWRRNQSYDVLVVDRQLPDGDGLNIVAAHRLAARGPVIVLTAKSALHERIEGIEADADYYLQKPVETDELIALLRRFQRRVQDCVTTNWQLDAERWILISPSSISVSLTRNELRLLACFVEHSGITRHKADVVRALDHDPATYDLRRLEVLVRRLRNKVESAAGDFPLITIYGVGYSFNAVLRQR